MIAFVDVDYRQRGAVAACVVASNWSDSTPAAEFAEHIAEVQAYIPGEFYKRELPCLLAVLAKAGDVEAVVIDGNVWLGPGRPGLGAHLHEALNQTSIIIGVAKTRFAGADSVTAPVFRGGSKTPLWVTAIGAELECASDAVRSMHGAHRIPTLIKRVDRLCRER
jgi:deoxyribonuclease V